MNKQQQNSYKQTDSDSQLFISHQNNLKDNRYRLPSNREDNTIDLSTHTLISQHI